MVSKVSAANNASVVSNTWEGGGGEEMKGVLPGERLMRLMPLDELHFHNWIHYDEVTF